MEVPSQGQRARDPEQRQRAEPEDDGEDLPFSLDAARELLGPLPDRIAIGRAEGHVMHPARALARLRQAGLDRDMQFGRRPAFTHLKDMDLALPVWAGIVAHQAHVHDLGQHGLGRGQFGNRDGDRPQPVDLGEVCAKNAVKCRPNIEGRSIDLLTFDPRLGQGSNVSRGLDGQCRDRRLQLAITVLDLDLIEGVEVQRLAQGEDVLVPIIADKGSYVSYLEGCTAPKRDENQLHAAVVEIVILEDAEVKYSTVQNWFPGDENGKGGIYNFVTKRADCREPRAKVMWTQVETGSAITWKYPSCILRGDDSQGEFYSIAIANNHQQADTGTKMIHLGRDTRSRIVSKGISAGRAQNTYRGLVSMHPRAANSRNYTQCDSLLIGDRCGAHTVPYIEVKNTSSRVEHEATTSKVDDDQLFYCRQRGMDEEEAVALVVNGFCREVLQALPMEFAMEAQSLVAISLEGSVG